MAEAVLPDAELWCSMKTRRRGFTGGRPAARPSFWTLRKYFCAWLRICKYTTS
jgi:hypothetical protein